MDDPQNGIVQLFVETETQLSGFKLKIPICLGSLISHQHVLTSRYCFGSDKYRELVGTASYKEIVDYELEVKIHEIKE